MELPCSTTVGLHLKLADLPISTRKLAGGHCVPPFATNAKWVIQLKQEEDADYAPGTVYMDAS